MNGKNFRTKIQAQRKFAQGQQPPSSAYLTYNLTSGNETPVKEKSQERELLPMRPNTEDFLTFLCFRGTNSLPKELDFQNSLNQPSTSSAAVKSVKNAADKPTKDSKTDTKKKAPAKKNETVTSKEVEESKKSVPEKDPKTGFMPFAVRKRAEVHPAKNDKKKLQNSAKKKHKDDLSSQDNEASNGPRTTRANPSDEKPAENNGKKTNKRKTNDESFESSSSPEKTPNKSAKLNKSAKNGMATSEKVTENSKKEVEKKKSLKKEEEKRQTRLSAVLNPSTSTPTDVVKNGKESPFDRYFSSSDDDDEPLVKAEPKNKKTKVQNNSISSSLKNETSTNSNSQPTKGKRGRKKKIVEVEPEKSKEKSKTPEIEISVEKKKVGRKKKTNVDLEIANSQANTTDLSENETRGRPMRKTKEAATIYMELIGRKLTLQDSSDNDSSLDSLEAPNLKRVELMEIELKANNDKAKAEASKKKQEVKI